MLDDPVSSLDHVFTGKIAARLAQEGLKRQVIIFTHNIAFLMELEDACEALAKAGRLSLSPCIHCTVAANRLVSRRRERRGMP